MQNQSQQNANVLAPLVSDILPRYLTVAQFAERNPAFSESAIRNIVFKADARKSTRGTIPGNGLIECGALLRLGRKVLIHEGRFFQWIESHGAN